MLKGDWAIDFEVWLNYWNIKENNQNLMKFKIKLRMTMKSFIC
jgi:hypothetical protein